MPNLDVLRTKLVEVQRDFCDADGITRAAPELLRKEPKYIHDNVLSIFLDMYLCEYAFSVSRFKHGQLIADAIIKPIYESFGFYGKQSISILQGPYTRVNEHAYNNEYLLGAPVFGACLSNTTRLTLNKPAAIFDIDYVANIEDSQIFVPGTEARDNLYIATAYKRRFGDAPSRVGIDRLAWDYIKNPNDTVFSLFQTQPNWCKLLADTAKKSHSAALTSEDEAIAHNSLKTYLRLEHNDLYNMTDIDSLYKLVYSLGFPLNRAISFIESKTLAPIEDSILPTI